MSTIEQPVEIDGDKLHQFVFRAVEEVGATLNAALVVMGDRLGLYRALAGNGGLSPAELAARSGAAERYVREWLNAQAAGGYVEYDPESGRYTLPPEQTVALTDPDSPAYLPDFPDRPGVGDRLSADRRGGPQRRWTRLARARARRPRGCERSSGRLQRKSCRVLAPGPRWRRGETGARGACRGRRLWSRLLHDPDGAGVPELELRRL